MALKKLLACHVGFVYGDFTASYFTEVCMCVSCVIFHFQMNLLVLNVSRRKQVSAEKSWLKFTAFRRILMNDERGMFVCVVRRIYK